MESGFKMWKLVQKRLGCHRDVPSSSPYLSFMVLPATLHSAGVSGGKRPMSLRFLTAKSPRPHGTVLRETWQHRSLCAPERRGGNENHNTANPIPSSRLEQSCALEQADSCCRDAGLGPSPAGGLKRGGVVLGQN